MSRNNELEMTYDKILSYDLKAILRPTISDLFKNHKTSNSFAKLNNLFRFSCIKIFENDWNFYKN